MEKLLLNNKDKANFRNLIKKPFKKMNPDEKVAYLRLGGKDFTNRFASTIRQLANE
jgi:hypothetical protein